MNARVAIDQWAKVDRLLNHVLALPLTDRLAFVQQQTVNDSPLRDEVLGLLAAFETRGDLLDRSALDLVSRPVATTDLAPGHAIGTYRVLALLGRGGMGEVYRAERADGQFDQQVALKLLRRDSIEHLGLFVGERRILAMLEHPGIARLYDAGVESDGRPYMVMELVEGLPITEWCRRIRAPLRERLALFVQVCEAVAYAHQHLVIHRDLKPANILVNAEGRIKLLDFGVAKLLSGVVEDATRNTPMTLAYAAPEQLTGAAIGKAVDVYALGVLLFELLTDQLPWATGQAPVAITIEKLLHQDAPAPSSVAASSPSPPVAARALTGDLDAIVAKALRKTASDRYRSVSDLDADISRHCANEPVTAREGARLYVAGRLLRRYRWAAMAVAGLVLALSAGLAGTLWQAHRAEQQARLAAASRDFMMGLFAAQDPQQSGDRPRQDLTVHQLLDAGVARIGRDFADQPEVQIELLGTASRIYNSLGDDTQLATVQARRAALARAHFGATHPIVIEQLINDANTACTRSDYALADRLLVESDHLLTISHADRTALRATWWQIKARVLGKTVADQGARTRALATSLALYEQVAPQTDGHAAVLSMMAIDRSNADDAMGAKRLLDRTVAIAQSATDRHDGHIAEYLFNLARTNEDVGDFDGALSAYARGEKIALATYGPQHSSYFLSRIFHARLLHLRGDAAAAAPIFSEALGRIPNDGGKDAYGAWAREVFAERLAAEGRADEALPLLEASYHTNLIQPQHDYDVRESARKLGDAYDRLGRFAAARSLLKSSRDDYIAKEGPTSMFSLVSRERWARFQLDHSVPGDADFSAAQDELRAIVRDAGDRPLPEKALALSGLARIALARGESAPAQLLSERALASLASVQKLHDVRLEPALWLVHSAALAATGDHAQALAFARRAEAASRRYDAPTAPSIVQAQAAVRQASIAVVHR